MSVHVHENALRRTPACKACEEQTVLDGLSVPSIVAWVSDRNEVPTLVAYSLEDGWREHSSDQPRTSEELVMHASGRLIVLFHSGQTIDPAIMIQVIDCGELLDRIVVEQWTSDNPVEKNATKAYHTMMTLVSGVASAYQPLSGSKAQLRRALLSLSAMSAAWAQSLGPFSPEDEMVYPPIPGQSAVREEVEIQP